mgnify:CR=1 FL=1
MVELQVVELVLQSFQGFCQCLGIHFSYFFNLHSLSVFIVITSYNKFSLHGKLLCGEAESLLCDVEAYAFHLEEDASWCNGSNPSCGVTLTFTHTHVSRLAGDWFVRENTDPNLSFTLHVAVHCHTSSLNLTAVDPFRLKCLYAERTECQLCATVCVALVATSVLRSSIFYSFWL